MPSNHHIQCRPLLLPPTIFPSIRVFSNELIFPIRWPKYCSFSFSISPSNEYWGLITFRMDWLDLLAVQGSLRSLLQHHSSKASILQHTAVFTVQLSHLYMTAGKTIALTRQTFVGKVTSLLFNMLSRLIIAFLPRSWQQSPSVVIFSSVQSCLTLQSHEPQYARPPCPSPTPRVHPNVYPPNRWCHPTISSHHLSSPSSPSLNLSQHQGFSYEPALHIRWSKYWNFSFNISPTKEHPGLISFRMDWLDLLAVQGTLKSLLQPHNSKASILCAQLSSQSNSNIHTWPLEKP